MYKAQATQELKRPTLGALGNSAPGRQTEIFGGFSKEQVQANYSHLNNENITSFILNTWFVYIDILLFFVDMLKICIH